MFRIGAIDSAATGLIPPLVHDLRGLLPSLELVLVEDKTAKLLPKLLSGALDIAFVRPPTAPRHGIELAFLLDEPTVVALPAGHALAAKSAVTIEELADMSLIVPSPRKRPHSYNLTMRLFLGACLEPRIVQQAEEKQTIVNLVGRKSVPRWCRTGPAGSRWSGWPIVPWSTSRGGKCASCRLQPRGLPERRTPCGRSSCNW